MQLPEIKVQLELACWAIDDNTWHHQYESVRKIQHPVLQDEKLYAKTSVFKVMVTIFSSHQGFSHIWAAEERSQGMRISTRY